MKRTLSFTLAPLMLSVAAALLCFVSCDARYPHEPDGGVAIALDNSRCPDVDIRQTQIFVYDTGGNLVAVYDYADAYAVASGLLPLEDGHYTVAVIVNADEAPSGTSTLTALREWISTQSGTDTDLLSGMSEVGVSGNRVIRVTLPLLQGAFSLSVLSVNFSMPEASMPGFTPLQAKSRAAEAGYILRCVAELSKAGTDEVVLHKAITPELQADGTYRVDLQLSEGSYDLDLWVDYARTEAPLADLFYHTESLKAVALVTEPYTANTDAKDAAYGNGHGITVPEEGGAASVSLQRPLAKYRFIVDDEETTEYLKLKKANPNEFPPIEELTVTVSYEGYFPSGFNASSGKPNDAVTGMSYTGSLSHYDGSATELEIGGDWIFVNGSSSFVKAEVRVNDGKGKVICRMPDMQIDYRRNELTTIKGRFLTSGANSGGISIDTVWEGSFDVWF